jgi:hypothetical protein
MPKNISLILFLLIGNHLVSAQSVDQIVIGTKHILHSDTLDEDRAYWVSLPESYKEENSTYKRYPILIVLDGNSHFRATTGIVNYMSSGYNGNRKIPEMIVVAIQNVSRSRDFTPDKT